MFTRTDLQRAAPRVLQRLADLVVLPAHGTVAGQAVASLFYEELGLDVRGPINDVDFFVSLSLPPEDRAVTYKKTLSEYYESDYNRKPNQNPTAQHVNNFDCVNYTHVNFICARNSVCILRSYRDGLRNFTLIDHQNTKSGGKCGIDVSQDIVDGFDLNLVGVGINLHKKKVVATDSFIDFLNTKTIEVVTCNTPAHTLIRLAKKVYGGQIVGALCDYDQQRRMLETHLNMLNHRKHSSWYNFNAVVCFGDSYYRQANRFAQYLPTVQKSLKAQNLYTFDQNTFINNDEDKKKTLDLIERINEQPKTPGKFLMDYVFVAHFTRVFELSVEKHTSTFNWDKFCNIFTDPLSDGQRLNSAHMILYGSQLETDCSATQYCINNVLAVFLFQNRKNLNNDKLTFIEQYNGLSGAEQIVFDHQMHQNPKKVFAFKFADHASEYWKNFLLDNGMYKICEIAEKNPPEVSSAIVEHLSHLIPIDNAFATEFLKDMHHSYIQHATVHLLHHCALETKNHIFQTLWKAKGVDPTIVHCTSDFCSVIRMAYLNELWLSTWSDHNTWRYANAFEMFIKNHTGHWGNSPLHITFVGRMLDILENHQLFSNQGKLLKNLMAQQHYDIILERVAQIPQRTDVLECLEDMMENHKSKKTSLQSNSDREEEEEDKKDLLLKLMLDLSVEKTQRGVVRKI